MLKGFAKILFAIILILVSVSLIIEMKYSISLPEYLAYSAPLTRDEEQYLQDSEAMIYGIDPEAAPFSSYDEEAGEYKGLIIDYMNFFSTDLGTKLQGRVIKPENSLTELENEDIDIIDLYEDIDGQGKYISTQPIYELDGVLITKYANQDITQYSDLYGKNIALIEGDFLEKKILKAFPKGQKMNIIYASSVKEGLQMLMDGQVDAIAADEVTIDYYAASMGINNDLRQVGEDLYSEEVSLGVNVYNTKLYNILNKEILSLKKSNAFTNSQEKWLGTSAAMVTDLTSVKWAQWIITFCVGLVVLLMIWESILNRRIDKATREIKIQKNNLQTVIDNINSLIAVINEDETVVQCNRYGKLLLKDEKGSFLNCGIGTIPVFKEFYSMYNRSPRESYYPYKGKFYSISVKPLSSNKKNKLITIEDCTEQVMTENKMRQETKMIAVGQLSAGLAHEIRNPLGLIKNYSYILRDYAQDDMSEHAVDVINESTNRIDNLIENLLSFSRLSNDKPSALNVEKLLRSIIELENKKPEKKNVRITLQCPKDLIITAREETIKIVVFNLINNAMDAFSDNSKEEQKLKIRAAFDDNILMLFIEDNGPGMPDEVVENIFNPFFTTKETGTGLGLYIVSSEIEKVNGSISVKSEVGKGTEFTVIIPEEQQEVAQ